MDAIATYSERRIEGRRQFSLYPEEVTISGCHRFGAHFEAKIPLKSLEPTVSRIFVRSIYFLVGTILAIGCTFICLILLGISPVVCWSYWPVLSIILFGIIGFLLVGFTFKKIEFAQFRSQAGVTILDVARSGAETQKFDGFIDALVRQIQSVKEKP